MSAPTKLRVLCLHGYRQTGEKLRGRIAAYRRAFKSSVEFVCVDAPIVVPYEPTAEEHAARVEQEEENGESQEDVRQFAWFNFKKDPVDGTYELSHVNESIEYLVNVCKEQGPFDGVFGFSQGGGIASMLLQLQQTKKEDYPFAFSFGIFVSAAPSTDERYIYCHDKLQFPSLHIMGLTDAVVSVDRSRALLETFDNPRLFEHSGGHYIPANKEPKDAMRSFIKDMQALVQTRDRGQNA